jgi:hypothetical protein
MKEDSGTQLRAPMNSAIDRSGHAKTFTSFYKGGIDEKDQGY